MKLTRPVALLSFAVVVTLAACVTRPAEIPDGLSAAELFQRAQDAADKRDFKLGLTCYALVQTNFPDDKVHGAWASYEIAFLYHKMGKNDTALTLLQQLLDQYATAGDGLPAGPRILAEKLKARLQPAPKPAS